MNVDVPKIVLPHANNGGTSHYTEAMQRILNTLLSKEPFDPERFERTLPIFATTSFAEPPFNLSFYFCSKFRPAAFHFFSEMISRWLIPGRRTNTLVQFAADFLLPSISNELYMGGEVVLRIESVKELEIVRKHLPAIETEIKLGLPSHYHAGRILEIKGMNADQKTAMIQENISLLVKHRPQEIDYDIFSEMQHFLVLCKEEFKRERSPKHMARILCTHYLFRKALTLSSEAFPERRYISVKLMRLLIGGKRVLGIALGISYLRDNEVLEERHLVSAVATVVSGVRTVSGSFLEGLRTSSAKTFYFEVEKENGEGFTLTEIAKLKEELQQSVRERIEERLNPLFMPENEEEIMRHMLTLGGQLKYVRDIPQAVINFHNQTQEELEFLVVMVRIVKPHTRTFSEIFDHRKTRLKFIPDRFKYVGKVRGKYEKEAAVFRVRICKTPFLRQDHAIDLFRARAEVATELGKVFGEFRDYNGGMISKESELLVKLRALLGQSAKKHDFLLENFFYSVKPAVMRSVVAPEPLKKLFNMVNRCDLEGEKYQFVIDEDEDYYFLAVALIDGSLRGAIEETLAMAKIPSLQLASCFVEVKEHPCFGLLYRKGDFEKWQQLQTEIERLLVNF